MAQRGEWTDGRKYIQTENLPILQDFVPYRGRCPASPMKTKEKEEQGKGTADHTIPYHTYVGQIYQKGFTFTLNETKKHFAV